MQARRLVDVDVIDALAADVHISQFAMKTVAAARIGIVALGQVENARNIAGRDQRLRAVERHHKSDRHAAFAETCGHEHHGVGTEGMANQDDGRVVAVLVIGRNLARDFLPFRVVVNGRGDSGGANLVGKLIHAGTVGVIPESFGTALGFGTFVIIVLTVTILVFRVMRVTLTEWVGDLMPPVRNMHVSSTISMVLTAALVLTGTWVYLWQMFGASNQLMAALSLLVVSVWLKSEKRNPTFALAPMIFMYVTTLAATAVTARNLYVTIAANPNMTSLPVAGAWAMIAVSVLLFAAAVLIGWDGYKAYLRYHSEPGPRTPRSAVAPPAE